MMKEIVEMCEDRSNSSVFDFWYFRLLVFSIISFISYGKDE